MTPIPLPIVFDLAAATTFAETLRSSSGAIVLNGAEVERIGVAGLQLLLSAHATATATGGTLEVENPSEALRAATRTAGADFLLATER